MFLLSYYYFYSDIRWTKYDNPSGEFCNVILFTVDKIDKGESYLNNYFGEETRCTVDRGCSNMTMGRAVFGISKGKKSLVSFI